ncbi:hypothetical protein GCM10017710_46650 [Arthrobacter ramosus]
MGSITAIWATVTRAFGASGIWPHTSQESSAVAEVLLFGFMALSCPSPVSGGLRLRHDLRQH